ncbi:MAG: recombinase family protein [Thermoguttaceae bacterium]|nr:recombinase family protein [Thermoguttaceae bacterium]MBR6388251.1 recombinase family protein [Thermoguttaceae bacterium]
MEHKEYGYARVSGRNQHEDRQMIALENLGIRSDMIFVDKQSGKDFEREQYQALLGVLRPNDVLFIKSIDRLGRDYREIIEQWRRLTKEMKVDVVVLDLPLLDTRRGKDLLGTFISDVVLQILSFVAENERVVILQRQREGIDAARRRGVKFGRPRRPLPKNFPKVLEQCRAGIITIAQAAQACKMPTTTFRRRVKMFLDENDAIGG